MPLLKTARHDVCFVLGWDFGRIDATICEWGSKHGFAKPWSTDDGTLFKIAFIIDHIKSILDPLILSRPASNRFVRLKSIPFESRTHLIELQKCLIHYDLADSPERARWLISGVLTHKLTRLKTGEIDDGKTQTPSLPFKTTELVRKIAETLAPESAKSMTDKLRRLLRTCGIESFCDAIASRAADQSFKASPLPVVEVDALKRFAWSPLRVFLGHSSQDKVIVRQIHQVLRSQMSIDAFLDEYELRTGDELDQALADAISKADGLLAVVSKNSVASRWFWKEVDFAERHGVCLFPLRIDDTEPPQRLSGILHGDLNEGLERGIERLICSMKKSPVLPFLNLNHRSDLHVAVAVNQIGWSSNQKCAKIGVTIRSESACKVQTLLLTTIGQWNIVQKNFHTQTRPIKVPEGIIGEIQAALGSKAVIPLSTTITPDSNSHISCKLYSRHTDGNGLGLYLFLLGAELIFSDFQSVNLGVILVDLHGLRPVAWTEHGSTHDEIETVKEAAEEIMRILPVSCAVDSGVIKNLREIAK